MSVETVPENKDANEGSFREIEALLREGWKFNGNDFQKDQSWIVVMTKEGEEDKVFHLTKAYPKMVDTTGGLKEG